MSQEENQKLDAEEAARIKPVPFGEAGLKLWREELARSVGLRELARLLLAGVDPDEAYRRAVEADNEATIAQSTINGAKPDKDPLSSNEPPKA